MSSSIELSNATTNANTSSISTSVEVGDAPSEQTSTVSMQDRILSIIETCPNRTIRPARLAAELGSLSVEDATSELCSVMAAVGSGASFCFETNEQKQHVMVFSFPKDFQQKARSAIRRQDWKERGLVLVQFAIKVIQLVTAFGLILSLLILSVAALLAMVAALIAISRAQQDRSGGTQRLMRQIRHVCLTIRQALWCYALFGPGDMGGGDGEPQHDGYMREMAYDLALTSSVCCGNPGSVFYWWRVHQLSRRRHRMARGWRREHDYETMNSEDVDGVRLIRPASRWQEGHDSNMEDVPLTGSSDSETSHRGILSVAVEFLFGPSSRTSRKRQEENKWKLRAAFLVRSCSSSEKKGVSLTEMSPFVDFPPSSLQDTNQLVAQGLEFVSHFHGAPLANHGDSTSSDMAQARFAFAELVSESAVTLRQAPLSTNSSRNVLGWKSLLYQTEDASSSSSLSSKRDQSMDFPKYYHEQPFHFTRLSAAQFSSCVALGVLNWLGVLWFRQATSVGGAISDVVEFQALAQVLRRWLVPVLVFYANLFWFLAAVRLVWILLLNRRLQERNRRRQNLAQWLVES